MIDILVAEGMSELKSFSGPFLLLSLGESVLHTLDADVLVARVSEAGKKEPDFLILGEKSLVPGKAFWETMSARPHREIYAADTRKGVSEMDLLEEDCPACGIAYYKDRLIQIMIGRGYRSKDVIWAGNPDEPKLRIGGILCPRNSFDTFMEKARKEARAWSTSDLHVFQAFTCRVCDYSHSRMMSMLRQGIEEANMKYFSAIGRAKENCEFFVSIYLVVILSMFFCSFNVLFFMGAPFLLFLLGPNEPRDSNTISWCHGM